MNTRTTLRFAGSVALFVMLTACAATTPAPLPSTVAAPPAASTAPAAQGREYPGFTRVVRNGEDYFCQTRTVTGSRARAAEICLTRDQMLSMEKVNQEYWRDAATSSSQSTIKMDSPR